MEATSLESLLRWTGGELRSGDRQSSITTICTDTRALTAGDLFLALRGGNFDGHNFVEEAARRGALGAIVEKSDATNLPSDFALLVVEDSLKAYQAIATNYRRSLPTQIVCITGSNGKTSTKDFTAAVLREHFEVLKTEGNLNNHIGLPLTLLRLRECDQIGVVEIGMNHAGEIAPLAAIAQPDVGIITNIGVAHIENLGSREAIAEEKGRLVEALQPGRTAILNADDEFTPSLAARTKADVVLCGLDARAHIRADQLSSDFSGMKFRLHAFGKSIAAQIPVPGQHMVQNALLAVAAGHVFGMSLEACAAALPNVQLTRGRLEMKVLRGVQIIDDSYNANPDSVKAGLLTAAQMSIAGRRVAVLGRMAELGSEAERGHRSVGQAVSDLGFDCLVTVGDEAALAAEEAWNGGVEKVLKCGDCEEAVKNLRDYLRAGDLLFVKGSRSSKMERIIEGLAAS